MFIALDRIYFEIGDKVTTRGWEGATAVVVAAKQDKVTGEYLYTLEVDVSNHPEGFDENGERVATMTEIRWASEMTIA